MANLKIFDIKLTRLSTTPTKLRTPVVIGTCDYLPKVGTSFLMFSKPIDPLADMRIVETSKITSVSMLVKDKHYMFTTETGSEYELNVID